MTNIVRAFEAVCEAAHDLSLGFSSDCSDPKVQKYLTEIRLNLSYLADSLVDMVCKTYGLE